MSQAVRTRKNRNENKGGSYTEMLCGAMVSVRTYSGEVRMLDVNAVTPATAAFAGKIDDDLLPGDD